MQIQRCTYYDAEEKVEWEIALKEENAIMQRILKVKQSTTPYSEKKKVPKEYIMNLDIFFSDDMWKENEELLTSDEGDTTEYVTIVSEEKEILYKNSANSSEKIKEMFTQIKYYFQNYWRENIQPILLSFHSFEGGGPEFRLMMEKKGIFTWYSRKHYFQENHENLCGAGFNVEFSLYPLRMGEATAKILGDSPICPQPPQKIMVQVDENFGMKYKIEELDNENDS